MSESDVVATVHTVWKSAMCVVYSTDSGYLWTIRFNTLALEGREISLEAAITNLKAAMVEYGLNPIGQHVKR